MTRHRDAAATGRRSSRGESDADLFRRIAGGDLSALGALYDRYATDVRAFADRATGRQGDGDDITHEVFLTVMRIAPTYDGRPSARPFLIGVTAQLIRRHHRGLSRVTSLLRELASTFRPVSPRNPEDASSDRQELRVFERALARLSAEKRLVLLMVDDEGLSSEEIAELLGVPAATVRTRLHYARQEIRAAMIRGRGRGR